MPADVSGSFVGRIDVLQQLAALLDGAKAGRPTVAIVEGETGAGKSALVDAFCTRVHQRADDECHVWRAACSDTGEAGPPGWAILNAIRSVRPDLLDPDVDTGSEPASRVFASVATAIERAAADTTIVLVVDDLHLGDRATRDLIPFLLSSLSDARLLVVATVTVDVLGAGHPLRSVLAGLRRHRSCEVVELGPLTRDEVTQLAGASHGRRDRWATAIWRRTGGNPLLVTELLDARSRAGGSPGEDESTVIPPRVRHLVRDRIDGVDEPLRDVLDAVAVAGDSAADWLLRDVVARPARELDGALRAGIERRLLEVDAERDAFRFAFPLLGDVVYDDLLPGTRARLHAACAQSLSDHEDQLDAADAGRLAHHWHTIGSLAEAYEAALTAADRAERERRFDQALHAFERAIEITSLVPDVGLLVGPGPAALLERAAEVAHLAGEHRRASQLLRLATDALPKEPGATDGDRVAVHPRLVRYLIASGDLGEALRAVEQPIAPGQIRVGDQASTAAARADALLRAGRYAESQREAEHALALARHTGDRVREADAWSTLGFDIAVLGESEAAIAALERAREIAEELGQPEGIGRADLNLAELLSGPLGRMDDAIDVAEAGVRRASELGLGRSYGVALQAVAINTRFRLGRWTDTEHLLDPPFDLDPTGAAALDLYLARTKLYVGQGDFNAALDDLDAVEALSAGSVGPRYRVPMLTLRAGLAMWQHRPDYARLAIAEALDDEIIFSDPWLLAPVLWHGLHAEGDIVQQAWSRRSEHEVAEARGRAAELLDLMRDLHRHTSGSAPFMAQAVGAFAQLCEAEHTRVQAPAADAQPGSGERAQDAWAEASALFTTLGQPYPAAYARWREAEAHLARRSRSSAGADALLEAHAVATDLGANPFRTELERLAARARISVEVPLAPPAATGAPTPDRRRPAAARLRTLTSRERDVLVQVAAGRTNREIAEQLFISPKTVSVHVSHILEKLGVRTRVQAGAVVHELERSAEMSR